MAFSSLPTEPGKRFFAPQGARSLDKIETGENNFGFIDLVTWRDCHSLRRSEQRVQDVRPGFWLAGFSATDVPPLGPSIPGRYLAGRYLAERYWLAELGRNLVRNLAEVMRGLLPEALFL